MMANSVATGKSGRSTLAHGRPSVAGHSTSTHHVDQAKCRLGIAAYWLDTAFIVPESNDHRPPYLASVSTNPYDAGSSRGGISGKKANPISASAVVKASVLRH